MIRRFLLVSVVIFIGLLNSGKNSVNAVSYPDWEGYPPMFDIQDVVEFQDNVYGATPSGMFRYNPETLQYNLYYKNHGLESGNVQCLGVSPNYIYMGFLTGGLWRFDPKNERFDPILFPEYMPNNISVRSIFAKNDSILYVGHSNGVDFLNLSTGELKTVKQLGNIPLGSPVNQIKAFNGKIWVCTENGLAVADENNPNLDIESSWKTYTYNSGGFTCIMNTKELSGESIFLGTAQYGLVAFYPIDGSFAGTGVAGSIKKISEGLGTYLAVGSRGLFKKSGSLWYQKDKTSFKSLCATEKKAWLGTDIDGMTRADIDGMKCYVDSGFVVIAQVPGPRSNQFSKIQVTKDNVVWATTALKEDYTTTLHRLQNDVWTTYGQSDGFFRTPVAVVLDSNENVWLADWGSNKSGVFVIQDDGTPDKTGDKIIPLDPDHTIIKDTIKKGYSVCSDITRDKHGYIWVANHQLDQPDAEEPYDHNLEPVPSSGAVVLNGYPLTKYQHYSPLDGDIPTAKIMRICADNDGWVWMGTETRGVMVLYVGDDPFDKSHREKQILTLESGLNSLRIQALQFDKDGYVWAGTDAGLNRITKFPSHSLKVEIMNQLLGSAAGEVFCIEVDHLNNKWIGTPRGIVKINAANELVNVYTTQNSGLFSNTIYSLKYDDKRDVLWVGTDSGINKFHVFGTQVEDTGKMIHVYPNPFSLYGTDSGCMFTNLKLGEKVRIFNFNGVQVNQLDVKDTNEKGISFARWNGRNFKNEYVASGVYFFIGVDKDGKQFRDKMVLIKR
jgi:hypothetical protein